MLFHENPLAPTMDLAEYNGASVASLWNYKDSATFKREGMDLQLLFIQMDFIQIVSVKSGHRIHTIRSLICLELAAARIIMLGYSKPIQSYSVHYLGIN